VGELFTNPRTRFDVAMRVAMGGLEKVTFFKFWDTRDRDIKARVCFHTSPKKSLTYDAARELGTSFSFKELDQVGQIEEVSRGRVIKIFQKKHDSAELSDPMRVWALWVVEPPNMLHSVLLILRGPSERLNDQYVQEVLCACDRELRQAMVTDSREVALFACQQYALQETKWWQFWK
jgi:hypothetical protein